MKIKLISASIFAAISTMSFAEDTVQSESWVGGFTEYYNADNGKLYPSSSHDGIGLGLEYGIKFNPSWAARIEWSHLNLDNTINKEDINGDRAGIDALFFPNESEVYVFAGVKYQKYEQSERLGNLGLGAHWPITDSLKAITEFAVYHDFGQDFNDYGVKIGLAYTFGQTKKMTKALDSDHDGVVDTLDQCPNTLMGVTVNSVGCEVVVHKDSDNDGIVDTQDNCPSTPMNEKVDSKGCTLYINDEVGMELNALFANNSAIVDVVDFAQFEEFADFMKRYPSVNAVIEGHSSSVGEESYNLMISEKRADAIKAVFVEKYDIAEERLMTKGFGESQLIDHDSSAKAHAANRRIVAKVSATERKKMTK